jgi:DNA-binding MarR family transcriptional regulator
MAKRAAAHDPEDPTGEFPLDPIGYFLHLAVVLDRRRDIHLAKLLRPLGMDVDTQRVMRVIDNLGSCTMGELADYTITDRTTLTRIIDHLVEAGLIDRAKPASDRRKVILTLTKAGKKAYVRARKAIREHTLELMRDLPENDVRIAARVQQTVVARLIDSELLTERLLWIAGSSHEAKRRD